MKVLIAGARGYIGARAAARLAAVPGVVVRGIGRGAGEERPVDLASDVAALRDAFAQFRPDVVINAAGTIAADTATCVSAHVHVTANLIAVAAELSPGSRFVQLGSAAEYGDAVSEPDAIDEQTVPAPIGPYGVSKLEATLLAVREGRSRGLEPISLRIFNLIGADMTPGTIIPNVLRFLNEPGRRPEDPLIVGNLDTWRDFVHIDDVVLAILAAATAPKSRLPSGGILNVASGIAVRVRDVVRQLLDAAGHTGRIDERVSGSGRSSGVRWAVGDNRLARESLGWQPTKSLSAALLELVAHE